MQTLWVRTGIGCLILTAHLHAGAVQPTAMLQAGMDAASAWRPLENDDLSRLRGGFQTDTGLTISFGIQRTAWANGQLMPPAGTFTNISAIQNQLDNRKFQVYTTINATITAASLMRSLNLQTALQDITACSLHH
jgi:hypothetical protein